MNNQFQNSHLTNAAGRRPACSHQKPFRRARASFGVLLLGGLLLSGCQILNYSGPNGEHFTRTSLGANTSIASLVVETDTNGLRRVELRGYQNDSTQALGTVTEAAVRAAIQLPK